MSTASSLSSARSRPDMLSPATGGLYLLTVAGRRIPFERMTEIDGSSLTFALDGSCERLGRELPARLAHGPARLLVGNPRGCLAGRRHEVRVRDHPSARADEPAGPGLAERRRTDELLSASATGHDDFRADLCDDEGDGRLRAEQGFLHGDLGGRRGDRKEEEEEEEERARDPGTHRTNLIPRSDE